MAVPLIVAGGVAAAGLIGGGIAAAANAGRNNRRAGAFYSDPKSGYTPNAFNYGGDPEGAQRHAGDMQGAAYRADIRRAAEAQRTTANYGQANNWESQGLSARAEQGQIANLMHQRAAGNTPSIAGAQAAQDQRQIQQGAQQQIGLLQQNAQNQMRQGQAQQAAQQASARGAAGVALAGQAAANNNANTAQQIGQQAAQQSGNIGMAAAQAGQNVGNQAQVNAMQERAQAEQAAMGAYSTMRGGDQASQAQAAEQAQFQAGLDQNNAQFNASQHQRQNQINDQTALGYNQIANQIRSTDLQAGVQNQAILANSYNNSETLNQQVAQANANRSAAWVDKMIPSLSDANAKTGMDIASLMKGGKKEDEEGDDVYSQAGKAKGGMDMGQMASMASMAGKFMSPGQAKRPLSLDEVYGASADGSDSPEAQWSRSFGSTDSARDEARKHDNMAEMQRIREGFGHSETKKTPWWMTPVSANAFSSPGEAKRPIDLGDVEDWDKGDPFRPAPSTSEAVAAKQREGRRDPKLFKRDTKADQRKAKEAYFSGLSREADAQIAAMRASLARGASVARDEGELDDERGDSRMAFMSDPRAKREAYMEGLHNGQILQRSKTGELGDEERANVKREFDRAQPPSNDLTPEAIAAVKREMDLARANEEASQAPPPEGTYGDSPTALPPPKPPAPGPEARRPPSTVPTLPNWGEVRGRNRPTPARQRMTSDEDAKRPLSPDRGPVSEANRAMIGTPYAYKPEYTPPHEREGQPHFGFMTQNLRKNPITRVAVEKDQKTGMDAVDRDRMLQVVAAGVADLQRQEDETRAMLGKGGRKGKR